MRTVNPEVHQKKKEEFMRKCYDCYAEYGLGNVGIQTLANACGTSKGYLYTYFDNLDHLIVESTDFCMSKVEDEFMAKAPSNADEVMKFVDEIPYWTAKMHGKKYRLMYQVYTNPKYIEYGKRFFEGVNRRYTEYAKLLEPKLGIPYQTILSFTFLLIRASVHYALFEDEYYLTAQITGLKAALSAVMRHGAEAFTSQVYPAPAPTTPAGNTPKTETV